MKEKVLKNRRRRASKGSPIRVSDLVRATLEKKRQGRASFDALLRKMLGLPKRNGEKQPLVEGWLEITTAKFYLDEAEANGAAVVAAAKNKTKKFNKPIRMREVG